MSAQGLDKVSGLVAINSLMAMAGGVLGGLIAGRNDPGFVHNGALAGLVAVCAGSDVMHPIGAPLACGMARVSLSAQILGTFGGVAIALIGGLAVYGALKKWVGIRMSEEDEFQGADLSIHRTSANPEEDMTH